MKVSDFKKTAKKVQSQIVFVNVNEKNKTLMFRPLEVIENNGELVLKAVILQDYKDEKNTVKENEIVFLGSHQILSWYELNPDVAGKPTLCEFVGTVKTKANRTLNQYDFFVQD